MTDVVFTQDEWALIKDALDEAYATRNYFMWLASTSLRITRDHIELPKLKAVLNQLNTVDIEHPRENLRVGESRIEPYDRTNPKHAALMKRSYAVGMGYAVVDDEMRENSNLQQSPLEAKLIHKAKTNTTHSTRKRKPKI